MYKNILLFFFTVFASGALYSQDWNEIYFLEGEAQYLINDKEFEKAIDIYRRMVKEVPDHSYAKYMIGKLYLQTDDKKILATEYLEEASQNIALDFNAKSQREIRTPVDVLLYLGKTYQLVNRVDEAIVVYNNYKDLITPDNESYPIVLHRIATCENAKLAFDKPLRVYKQNLGEPLNDKKSNFNAVVSGDGQSLIYTSYTRNYMDNYYSQKVNGVWGSPKKISEKLSTKYYLKTCGLSYDGEKLFLTTDDPEENDVFVCYKDGKNWTEATKLPKGINGKKSNETHASISNDGKTLYFTSDRKDGYGGLDIYKSILDAKGKWGEPVNLGPNVNTAFNEETPCATMDDTYLFFSSEGHNSIGGFDVFYIGLSGNSTAVNLGYPANTTGDDLFFVPENSVNSGWISRYDSTSAGKNDIYHLSILPKIRFAGNIKNITDNEIIGDPLINISVIEARTNEIITTQNPNNGKFEFEIFPGLYHIVINNDKYDTFTHKIDIPEDFSDNKYLFEALLNPIAPEQEDLIAEAVSEENEPLTATEEPLEKAIAEKLAEEKTEIVPKEATEIAKTRSTKNIPKKSKPVTIIPEKEIVKYEPGVNNIHGKKTYSVQLMALKNPVDISFFKDVDNVKMTKYSDGFYRYTVGNTSSYKEAQLIQKRIHSIGYKNTFIRINDFTSIYPIQ